MGDIFVRSTFAHIFVFIFNFVCSFISLCLARFFNYIYARTLRIRNVGNGGTFNPFWGMTTFAFACGCCSLISVCCSLPNASRAGQKAGLSHGNCNCNCGLGRSSSLAALMMMMYAPTRGKVECNMLQVKNFHLCITAHRSRRGQSVLIGEWRLIPATIHDYEMTKILTTLSMMVNRRTSIIKDQQTYLQFNLL